MSARSDDARPSRLLLVVGPTASGKTALAVRLAELFDAEIVSADSVQIYRHFDVGSGKATAQERRAVPHHLIDHVEPTDEMDASLFAAAARAVIADVRARGRMPIVCGGTFLWVRALLYGLAPAPPKDDAIREAHRVWAEREGRTALHQRLGEVDPECARRLNPNDFVRVSRALEVYELTGEPLSTFQRAHGFSQPHFDARFVGVLHDREMLAERIRERVVGMFEAGWVDEVKSLLQRGFGDTRPMQSVGYMQMKTALCTRDEFDQNALIDEIARATRVFSRRQRTWLREQPVKWLRPDELQDARLRVLLDELWGGHHAPSSKL